MWRSSRKATAALFVAFVVALMPTGTLLATTAVAVDTQFMTDRASSVVLATVESRECRWNDAHTKIYTYTVLNVQDDFKGETRGKRITVRQLGGSAGDVVCYVPGQPAFHKGEKVFVFLRRTKAEGAIFRVVGMAQGKYSVLGDGTALRDLEGLQLLGPHRDRARRESREHIDRLIQRVREIVAAQSRTDRAEEEGEV